MMFINKLWHCGQMSADKSSDIRMWRHLYKSTLVGEEKPVAGINASTQSKCQQIDFSGIAARRRSRSETLPVLGATRVATVRAMFRRQGHSRCASEFMTSYLRPSSITLYESHWSQFVTYCARKNINVFNVRSHQFSRYLMYLFDKGLALTSLTGLP